VGRKRCSVSAQGLECLAKKLELKGSGLNSTQSADSTPTFFSNKRKVSINPWLPMLTGHLSTVHFLMYLDF
jgi:hypothetical protein